MVCRLPRNDSSAQIIQVNGFFARKLAFFVALLLCLGATAQTRPSRLSDAHAVRLLPKRASLDLFVRLYKKHHDESTAFTKALIRANIQPKVKRICYVYGGYPEQVVCSSLETVFRRHFQLSQPDHELLELAFNDLWESAGGDAIGGDLTMCGGTGPRTVTHVMANGRLTRQTRVTTEPKSGAERVRGAAAQAMVSACRAAQLSSINGGIGVYTPGTPGYREAVGRVSSFLTGFAVACSESGTGMIEDHPAGAPSGQKQIGVGEALAWVAGVTTDLAGGLSECTSKAKCAVGLTMAAVSLTADANDLVGDEGNLLGEVVDPADTVLDIVGGAMGVVALAEAATVAEMVLPAIAVGVASYTIVRPLGDAIASNRDSMYITLADELNDVLADDPAPPGDGVEQPSEDGRPSCETMAARAARFNAYCSQPGNNWQSYDCMLFVARLVGCADPGLIRPAPGQDFSCGTTHDDRDTQRVQCEHRERVRGWLSAGARAISTGDASRCGIDLTPKCDLAKKMRQDICTRVLTEGSNDFCTETIGPPAQRRP